MADCADFMTEFNFFFEWILDTLQPTATGLDEIPAWFLWLGAPIFAAPLAFLFNKSLAEGVVLQQWKTAVIAPILKLPYATQPSEYTVQTPVRFHHPCPRLMPGGVHCQTAYLPSSAALTLHASVFSLLTSRRHLIR